MSSPPRKERIVAKLRMERAGRGGKTVSVVYDLPRKATYRKTSGAPLRIPEGIV